MSITKQLVWMAYLSRHSFGAPSRLAHEEPYLVDEDEAKKWVEQTIHGILAEQGDAADRWHLTGHVEAGYAGERNGQPVYEPLEDGLYNQIYNLIGTQWVWTTVGVRPGE